MADSFDEAVLVRDELQEESNDLSDEPGEGDNAPDKRSNFEDEPDEENIPPPADRPSEESARPQDDQPQPRMNPDFQDVNDTGKWGKISRKEIMIVSLIAILAIVGVVLGVVLTRDNDDSDDKQQTQNTQPTKPDPPTPTPTTGPTHTPTLAPTWARLDPQAGLAFLKNNTVSTPQELPTDASDLVGQSTNSSASPLVRAADWVLHVDDSTLSSEKQFAQRFVLALFYYYTNGDGWTDKGGWLQGSGSECDWLFVKCDDIFQEDIVELVVESNNLVGSVPHEISFLTKLRVLTLRENKLTGPLPTEAIKDSKDLTQVFLENNQFTGAITNDIIGNGKIIVLYVHFNNLTGSVPSGVCTKVSASPSLLLGVDCSEVTCRCCSEGEADSSCLGD